MSGLRTQAALLDGALAGHRAALWAGKHVAEALPPRDVEAEAIAAWRAVDTLTTADPRDWRENIGALVEMQERIERMIEGAAK
jgi:hypothetical protein